MERFIDEKTKLKLIEYNIDIKTIKNLDQLKKALFTGYSRKRRENIETLNLDNERRRQTYACGRKYKIEDRTNQYIDKLFVKLNSLEAQIQSKTNGTNGVYWTVNDKDENKDEDKYKKVKDKKVKDKDENKDENKYENKDENEYENKDENEYENKYENKDEVKLRMRRGRGLDIFHHNAIFGPILY
jgi:hypothetical protein